MEDPTFSLTQPETIIMESVYDELINSYGFDQVLIQYEKQLRNGYDNKPQWHESVTIQTYDTFQDNVEYCAKQNQGSQTFNVDEMLSKEWRNSYMSRAMREISVLAAQSNQSKLIMDQLVTLKAKEFAEKLVTTREELGSWITDQRGTPHENQ